MSVPRSRILPIKSTYNQINPWIHLTVHFRTSVTPSIRYIAHSLFITSSITCLVFDTVVPYEWPLPKVIIHTSVSRTQHCDSQRAKQQHMALGLTVSSSDCTAAAAEFGIIGFDPISNISGITLWKSPYCTGKNHITASEPFLAIDLLASLYSHLAKTKRVK
jgi:hypothetical protein